MACPGQTLQLICDEEKGLKEKKIVLGLEHFFFVTDDAAGIIYSLRSWQVFQVSLIFSGKAVANPSAAPYSPPPGL